MSKEDKASSQSGAPVLRSARPLSCCVPSLEHLNLLRLSQANSLSRKRINTGSTSGMVKLEGGPFLMGSEDAAAFLIDGEAPVRKIRVSALYCSTTAITNTDFRKFVVATGYKTEAERFGWSFVFQNHCEVGDRKRLPGTPWWIQVNLASWSHPEGPDTSIDARLDYPVVHVSWNDAVSYCEWAQVRLPTEAEWEYAARGGVVQKNFWWGDELTPNGAHMCNVWQGIFPTLDAGEDGFANVAPAYSYSPNDFGLYNMHGNHWEWCSDFYDVHWHLTAHPVDPAGPPSGSLRVLKGGSFLCHETYCNRYRVSARIGNEPDTSSSNIGFRVVRDH